MLKRIGLLFCLVILFLNPLRCFADSSYISVYPPEQNTTYVKATSTYDMYWYAPYSATDPTKWLTGNTDQASWLTPQTTNQRFHIDLGTSKIIKRIYYENWHGYGANTNRGVQNFTLWGSNSAGDFADLVYADTGTWVQLTTSQSTFDRHVAFDQADPKYITVTNTTAYRYYAFKFADNYGTNYMGVCRIELQIDNAPPGPSTSLKYIRKKKGIVFKI